MIGNLVILFSLINVWIAFRNHQTAKQNVANANLNSECARQNTANAKNNSDLLNDLLKKSGRAS